MCVRHPRPRPPPHPPPRAPRSPARHARRMLPRLLHAAAFAGAPAAITLGFGRIVASAIEAPNLSANLV
jgi:hypothetical protein